MSEIQNTGQFSKVIVTKVGKEMIAKSQNGQTLTFTRVALGDGLIGQDEDPVNFTALKSERLSANIAKYTDKGNGQFELQFRVSNQEVETGFWHREIGVMAKIDEGPEQLYAYTTAGNQASFLYDKTTPVEERIVNIAFVIGNAQNVQVVVNSSVIYVTLDDMKEAITAHNTNADSHAEAFNKHDNNANTHELAFNKHNADINAHSNLFNKKLDKAGGTLTGDLNVSGHNITATKFIGNLQGKADSAANADLAAKATTAENANNSSVANKLGTSTVGSATKPVYINNGVASAVSVDLSTLAPKESPALSGTPTAPTPATSVNNTQLATTAFVQSLLSSRFTASKNDNGWWKDGNTGMIFQFFSYKPTTNYKDAIMPAINFPISFPNKCILVLPVLYNDDSTIYHDIAIQPVSTTNSSVIFYSQLHEPNPLQNITGTTIKALAIGY